MPIGRSGTPSASSDASAAGNSRTPRHEANVAAWLPLRRWDPAIAKAVHAVHQRRRPTDVMAFDAYCAAPMTRWL